MRSDISILFFVLTSMPTLGFAADCPNIRLDKAGGPFANLPVYDQTRFSKTDQSICYAVTGAQLIDADRFFNGDTLNKLTSPISVALAEKAENKTGDESPKNPLTYGSTESALAAINNKDVCDQNFLENYVSLKGKLDRNPLSQNFFDSPTVSSTENFFRAVNDQAEKFRELNHGFFGSLAGGNMLASDACYLNFYFSSRIGNENLAEIATALKYALQEEDVIARSIKVLKAVCADHKISIDLGSRIMTSNGFTPEENAAFPRLLREAMRRSIDLSLTKEERDQATLDSLNYMPPPKPLPNRLAEQTKRLLGGSKPVPIEISITAFTLKKGERGGSMHSAVIVGGRRHADTKECEFLVRNSYGPSCFRDGGYGYDCENGSVWVPENKLFAEMEKMTWIQR